MKYNYEKKILNSNSQLIELKNKINNCVSTKLGTYEYNAILEKNQIFATRVSLMSVNVSI